jgi:membrane dipeptidase
MMAKPGMVVPLEAEQERRARRLHDASIIIDTLAEGPALFPAGIRAQINRALAGGTTAIAVIAQMRGPILHDLVTNAETRTAYLDAWDAAGVTCVSATQGDFGTPPFSYEAGLDALAHTTRLLDALPDHLVKATRAADIRRAKQEHKRAFVLNFQNTTHFGLDWQALERFVDLGVRVIQLTYNTRNFVGDGCTERTDSGLSRFGIELVRRLNEMGVLIDLSHCGLQTAWDAVRTSKKPVACTHTFCSALSKHDRGKPDDLLRAVADGGGYVGLLAVPFFISDRPDVTLEAVMNHLEHAIEVCGIDHVGIGTDWGTVFPGELADKLNDEMNVIGFRPEHRVDWHAQMPDYRTWEDWPNITRRLVQRGFSDQDIGKILGLNFLSVFERVVG